MSDQTPFDIGRLMPGFDFLRQLAGSGASASRVATGLSHWAAPTISVDELEQRIAELKAVQFWLEQNLVALKATVQALEVQKMTLVALHSMNVGVGEIAKAFTLPEAAAQSDASPAATEHKAGWPYGKQDARASRSEAAEPDGEAEAVDEAPESDAQTGAQAPAPRRAKRGAGAPAPAPASAAAAAVTDPMQWWSALTQQFQQIAAEAMREAAQAMPAAAEPVPAGKRAGTRPAARKKPAVRKTATRKSASRKTAARKVAPRKEAAEKESAPREAGFAGWPLPAAFKPRSR